MNKEEWLKKGYVDEPVDEFTDLKKEIDKLRKEKNATKEDLAAHLGITVRAYRYYEEGKRYPDFQGLIALADYFGVTLDDLVGRTAPGL